MLPLDYCIKIYHEVQLGNVTETLCVAMNGHPHSIQPKDGIATDVAHVCIGKEFIHGSTGVN